MPLGIVTELSFRKPSYLTGEPIQYVTLTVVDDRLPLDHPLRVQKPTLDPNVVLMLVGGDDIYGLIGKHIRYNVDDIGIVTGIQVAPGMKRPYASPDFSNQPEVHVRGHRRRA